jgi:FkbM family methyltransferase
MGRKASQWIPPSSFEERLKNALVPPRLYHILRAHRELRRGETELGLLPYLVDRKRNAVDVGANKGVYTYWLQRYSRHVYAYEPNPKMFRILKAGARGNVTVSPVALSQVSGKAILRVPETKNGFSNQGASLSDKKPMASSGEVEVETRRMDDEGLADIGFMKIDVEGFELAVLEGARETLRRDRPVLLIEIEESHNRLPLEESFRQIGELGYRGYALLNGVLSDLSRFDVQARHRNPARRDDYVFNFLFLPTDERGKSDVTTTPARAPDSLA